MSDIFAGPLIERHPRPWGVPRPLDPRKASPDAGKRPRKQAENRQETSGKRDPVAHVAGRLAGHHDTRHPARHPAPGADRPTPTRRRPSRPTAPDCRPSPQSTPTTFPDSSPLVSRLFCRRFSVACATPRRRSIGTDTPPCAGRQQFFSIFAQIVFAYGLLANLHVCAR